MGTKSKYQGRDEGVRGRHAQLSTSPACGQGLLSILQPRYVWLIRSICRRVVSYAGAWWVSESKVQRRPDGKGRLTATLMQVSCCAMLSDVLQCVFVPRDGRDRLPE